MKEFFIWAHRGASAVAPENTCAAFAAAVQAGAAGIELDVQLTRDRIPVVIHDETVDRTTDGSGRVQDLSFAEIRRLDAGGWLGPSWRGEPVPSLETVLDRFGGKVRLNIEVKDARAGQLVAEMLQHCGTTSHVVSTFDRTLLQMLRNTDAMLPLAVLLDQSDWHRALALASQLKAISFHPRLDLLSRPMLSLCGQRGLPVFPWTLDEPLAARRLMQRGVAGVFTNDPARLIRILPR